MSSTLCSLPCESLCLIASQLEGPDRQSLRRTCKTAAQAASLSTHTLVLPGSQLLSGCQSYQQAYTPAICSCSDSWGCACTVDAGEGTQAPLKPFSDESGPSEDTNSSIHISEQSCSFLQRYSGVRSFTVTCCDACEGIATPTAGPFARVPGSPHTPTQTSSWISSCCSPSTSSCLRSVPQAPQVSLSSFLAAAGSTMPYLQHLDLSTVCPCLHSISGGILEAIAGSCPRLETLSVPTWLLQPPEQQHVGVLWTPPCGASSFSMPLLRLPDAAWDPTLAAAQSLAAASGSGSAPAEPYGLDRLWLRNPPQQLGSLSAPSCPQVRLSSQRRVSSQQQQQVEVEGAAVEGERLSSLAALASLKSLKLFGAAPPASALKRLAGLTQLQKFALEVTDTMPNVPVALSELPGWQGSALDSGSSVSSGGSISIGAVLGTSLAVLTGLTSISLTGALHAGDTLKALTGLPKLVRVEIDSLPDFSVGSLASMSGLTRLTALRVQGCKALQATARSALPLQLHVLQELAVLELDFDLHLRDMQVLCLLRRLSHLTANSFHHCIHLMTGLTLPALRYLRVRNVSRFALQQQQPGLPANLQLAQALAGPQLAAAAAAAMAAAAPGVAIPVVAPPPPLPAAAGTAEGVGPDLPAAAAAAATGAGAPVMPLSALPVLLNLQQQQQQHQQADEPPPFMLLAAPGGQALLLQHQQQHAGGAPVPMQLPAHPQLMALPGIQQQQQAGMPGFNLQLLQLRQQQLHLQQQQIRLQQQQVRLQLQQMQAQFIQQAQQQPSVAGLAAAAAAAAGAGQAAPAAAPQQGAAVGPDMPAAAAAACAQPKGWLAVLFPGLEELHLTSAQDCAVAVPALQGHQTLQRLVIGTRRSGPPQQQLMGLLPPCAQGTSSVLGAGSVGGGALYGAQSAGYSVGRGSRGVGAPWGVLRSLASLEELEIHDTGVVLGTTPWTLGVAVAGQLCRLVLRDASSLTDLSAATLLGPYTWSKLTHLEIQGAEVLSNRGLNCFASLPALQHLHLSYCPGISACGLASFLLSSSSSMRKVDLLCCAGVQPAEAQAVQDAVWGITHRRVEVSWSRHDRVRH